MTAPRPVAWAGFAGLLAMAGLPLYIHAPKFYADNFGIPLATLGTVLFGLRLLDLVQDPALGWLARATAAFRGGMVAAAAAVLAGAMLGLFAVTPPVNPLLWFALMLTLLFSAFSFLTIVFYAQGIARAALMGEGGHLKLAAWREGGALLGVCTAAAAPTLLALGPNPPYQAFAILFAAFALLATRKMHAAWGGAPVAAAPLADFKLVLRDGPSQLLLVLALVNSAPVAVSATLFLFFVESRLQAPGWEGPLLIGFFLSAALAAPVWSRLAQRHGTRRMLLWGMSLAIFAFGFAATLGPGDAPLFALVCIASGAALGADLTLLPALFARRMASIAPEGSAGFALWSFAGKFALALAAITVLPFLQSQGFTGPSSPPDALVALGLTYALVPCALKLLAIALLATAPESEPVHA